MKNIHILLVEDNEGDVALTKEAFASAHIKNEISVVNDGEKALDFLYQRDGFSTVPRPDLILMDINMPKLNGLEILDIIKHDARLKKIPVIILTSSASSKDMLEAFRNYADRYITKPLDFIKFAAAIAEIKNFWFTIVTPD